MNDNRNDKITITVLALILYGLILLGVVFISYIGVKALFRNQDKKVEEILSSEALKDSQSDYEENEATVSANEEKSLATAEENVSDSTTGHIVDSELYLSENCVNYSETIFHPGNRDVELKWEDKVFAKLENVKDPSEALVNSYKYSKRFAKTSEGEDLEFGIYRNEEDCIEKITEIRKINGTLEITDFYYDSGDINYAAKRRAFVDVPIDISSGAVTSRYYFNDDVMVKYSYCENNTATVFKLSDIDEYSEGTVGQYNELEKEIVNEAYITYNAVVSLPNVQKISGYIFDEYDMPMKEVDISITRDSDNKEVARLVSDGDGRYQAEIDMEDGESYTLTASKASFDEAKVFGINSYDGAGVYYAPTLYMTYANDGTEYYAQIIIRDATENNLPVGDAILKLRNGLNCKTGEEITNGNFDANGAVMFKIQAGNYTAQVSRDGYETAYFNVVVNINRQATIGYLVKDLSEEEMQVVLSFETTPLDIDGKLISANKDSLWVSNQDSVGALNAEAFKFKENSSDCLRYFVSDYTNCTGGDVNSASMSKSKAKVEVYASDGLREVYEVPLGHLGVVWEVFNVRCGKLIPINRYYNSYEPDSYFTEK